MKKSLEQLLKVASKFQRKYAQGQTLQEILTNASSYGESSGNGIMNFIPKLKEQKGYLGLTVNVSSGFTGVSVNVSSPSTEPPALAGTFAKLSDQVKKYLERNIKGFPQITEGSHNVSWDFRDGGASNIAGI